MQANENNGFWKELPSSDDPAAFHLSADTLLRLHTYWLGMFTVASTAYAEHGRPGVNDVRTLAGRAARLLTIAAEQRGYESSSIRPGHEAATKHLGEKAAQADNDDGELATHTKPDAPAYQRAVDELGRLRIKLVAECQRDIAADATPQDLAAAVRRLADLIEAGKIRASAHTEADRVRVMAVEMFNREGGGRYRQLSPDQQSIVDTYRDLAGAMPALMGKAPASNPAPSAAELRRYADAIDAPADQNAEDDAMGLLHPHAVNVLAVLGEASTFYTREQVYGGIKKLGEPNDPHTIRPHINELLESGYIAKRERKLEITAAGRAYLSRHCEIPESP